MGARSAGSKGKTKAQVSGISRLVKWGPGLIGMGTPFPYDQSPRRGKKGRHGWAVATVGRNLSGDRSRCIRQ